MKILFISPGSGDSFYCGNCFRDNLQANALRRIGHEVIVMPIYLPLKYPSFKGDTPLFFPAITVYTAQKFFRKGRMPHWVENFLNSSKILNMAAAFSGSTSAAGLEDMTLSMIKGDDAVFGKQAKTLINWIELHEKPDIIHLSSTLLIGIAKALKQRLKIPVVCSLQDEEVWIESMKGEYLQAAWQGITENLKYIDQFTASSEFYKNIITTRIPCITNIKVIYPGVNTERYASNHYPDDPVIGFFYRMNRENGLDILAEAFVKLKNRDSIKNLKLKIAGGYTTHDKLFLKKVKKILSPYINDVDLCRTYSPDNHADFYSKISIICVPLTFDEGVGLYLCEAFAAGRPAVEPRTGSFPEITDNAGLVYSPNNSDALANAIEKLLTDKDLFTNCRINALQLSHERYSDTVMGNRLQEVYEKVKRTSCC